MSNFASRINRMQILIVARISIRRAWRTRLLLRRLTFRVWLIPRALTKGTHGVFRLCWKLSRVNISRQKLSFHFLTRPGADDARHNEYRYISVLNLIQIIWYSLPELRFERRFCQFTNARIVVEIKMRKWDVINKRYVLLNLTLLKKKVFYAQLILIKQILLWKYKFKAR